MFETEIITVRYWAAAKAAAGVAEDAVPVDGPVTLGALLDAVRSRHPDPRFADVLGVCSMLVGEQPVGTRDPADVRVEPGQTVEFLPPFAGG